MRDEEINKKKFTKMQGFDTTVLLEILLKSLFEDP